MKKIGVFFLLLLIISCNSDKNQKGKLTSFLPENTVVLVRSNSLKTLDSDLANNGFIEQFAFTSIHGFFSKKILSTKHFQPVSEVLIAVSKKKDSIFDYTFITRSHPQLFTIDSAVDKTVETISLGKNSFQKTTLDTHTFYSTIIDSVFVASSSENIIQHYFESQKHEDEIFKKLYEIGSSQPLSVFVNGREFSPFLKTYFPDSAPASPLFSWILLDTDIHPDILKLNGITSLDNSDENLVSVFKNTLPQTNRLATVTPVSASGFVSFTFDDFETFQKNLSPFQEKDTITVNNTFFLSLKEAGVIFTENEKIVATEALDATIAAENLSYFWNEHSTFREISIKKVIDSTFINRAFYPLIKDTRVAYGAQLDNFFVFTEKENTLTEIITEYLNETTLAHRPFYQEHLAHLSSDGSVLLVSLNQNFKSILEKNTIEKYRKEINSLKFSNTPILALQLVADGNFAHINGVVKETKRSAQSTGVSQLFAITLDNDLQTRPQFFSNHITKGKDIVVQDVANKLYLISPSGKVLWNKQLDGKILGEIQEVDLLKNGRIQMVFATEKTFYILDRNGKEVAPFPLKFKDPITQPLAVFDYDSNRNYRFVVTQSNNLLMYDSKAKIVSGFTFKKSGSAVILPPQHFRIGGKDYLLIAEESGKLNILSRTGSQRVNVTEKFDFGTTPLFIENEQFVFIDKNNQKISISQSGKVTKQELGGVTYATSHGKTTVQLADNLLRINNHRVELPLGDYTAPEISISNNRILISVTDRLQQRVYVYNSLGEIVTGFPVYGASVMQLGDATANGRPDGVVQGGSNEVVCYELN